MNDFVRERVCFYSSMFKGRSSAEEIIGEAIRRGVAGVELMSFCDELREPDMAVARELGRRAKSAGLVLPCFSVGISLTDSDGEEQLEKLKAYADVCAALEIPYLHHTISSGLTPPPCEELEDRFRIGCEMALRINEYAATLGVKTLVEDQGYVFNGVKNYRRFRDVTEGKIGTLLDVGNIMFVGERAEDFLAAFSDSICHVHLKDYLVSSEPIPEKRAYHPSESTYLIPVNFGEGDVRFDLVAKGLCDADYHGYFAMEYEGSCTEESVSSSLELVGKVFG